MNMVDKFLSKILIDNKELVKKDYFSILHIVISIFKETQRPFVR